jgi:hypothetical protein
LAIKPKKMRERKRKKKSHERQGEEKLGGKIGGIGLKRRRKKLGEETEEKASVPSFALVFRT